MDVKRLNIAFLCGYFNPENEAVSKQIMSISKAIHSAIVYSLAEGQNTNISFKKKLIKATPFSHRFLFPFLSSYLEKKTKINHIFYSLSSDPFLKRIGNNPIIFTCVNSEITNLPRLNKVSIFVFECERDRTLFLAKSEKFGLRETRTDVILPGINLYEWQSQKFLYITDKFKILFASMPFEPSYSDARGLHLITEAAKKLGHKFEFIILNRMPLNKLKQITNFTYAENIKIISEKIDDIKKYFHNSHITILPFTSIEFNKSCPLSLIESLASGRPVIVSDKVGVQNIIAESDSGLVCKPTADDLCEKITMMRDDYMKYQKCARSCAEKYFSEKRFVKAYSELYQDLLK